MKLNELLQLADSGRSGISPQEKSKKSQQTLPGEWKSFFLKAAREALPGADAVFRLWSRAGAEPDSGRHRQALLHRRVS